MNSRVISCPLCGSRSSAELRYCRQCGTSLEVVMRALRIDRDTEIAAVRESASPRGRSNELAVLLTASVALLVYTIAVFTIGLGLVVAGKLGFALTSIWIVALAGPIIGLGYYWMRRWTRARTASNDKPLSVALSAPATTRLDFDDAAPTARQILAPTEVEDVPPTRDLSDADVTRRLPE